MSRTFGVTLHGTEYMVTVREIPTPQEDITATDSTGDIDSGYTEGTVLDGSLSMNNPDNTDYTTGSGDNQTTETPSTDEKDNTESGDNQTTETPSTDSSNTEETNSGDNQTTETPSTDSSKDEKDNTEDSSNSATGENKSYTDTNNSTE